MLYDLLAFIGAALVGASLITLIVWLGIWFKRVCRVVRDYHNVAPNPEGWGDHNLLNKLIESNSEIRRRLYIVERDGRNACYRIGEHAKNYKHTKTAKKVAIDKERKQVEKEYQHDADVRGGDGM